MSARLFLGYHPGSRDLLINTSVCEPSPLHSQHLPKAGVIPEAADVDLECELESLQETQEKKTISRNKIPLQCFPVGLSPELQS